MISQLHHRLPWIATSVVISGLCSLFHVPLTVIPFVFLSLLAGDEVLAQINPYPALRRSVLILALLLILPVYPGQDFFYTALTLTILGLAYRATGRATWVFPVIFTLTALLSIADVTLALFMASLALHQYLPRQDWNVLWCGFSVLPATTMTLLYLDGNSLAATVTANAWERMHWPLLLSGPSLTEPLSHTLILASGIYCLHPHLPNRRIMSALFYYLILVTILAPLKVHHGSVEFVGLTFVLSACITPSTLEVMRSQGKGYRLTLFFVILFLCLPYVARLGW